MKTVAIDGPSGAGKSTIARLTASKLGYIYVDTGALYRAVGLFLSRQQTNLEDVAAVTKALGQIEIDLAYQDGEQHVLLNGEDVSGEIRTPEASMIASSVSAIGEVRTFLLSLQQQLAQTHSVIMDGRDIGTVVLPNADVKIFLTATAEDRAQRRYQQLLENGISIEFSQLLKEIEQRDYNDSHRAIAPLKPADDAILIDTTGNTLEQSIQLLYDVISEKLEEIR